MIVERITFNAKFGHGDAVVEAFKEWEDRMASRFGIKSRYLVDLTGPMFRVIVETEYQGMAQLAQMQAEEERFYQDPEFQQWFGRWSGLVETGDRELLRVVA